MEKGCGGAHQVNILGFSTFAIDDIRGGGQHVVYHLYKELSKVYNITLLSVVEYGKPYKEVSINNRLRNIIVPQSLEQAKKMASMEQEAKIPLFDIIQAMHLELNEHFIEKAQKLVNDIRLIMFEHPYLINIIDFIKLDKLSIPIVYHAIDTEFNQKKKRLSPELLNYVKEIEERACTEADIIFAVAEYEANTIKDMYSVPENKIEIIPHGINVEDIPFYRNRTKIDTMKHKEVLFIGSWHPPNLEALLFIIDELASKAPWITYTIIGSIKDYFLHDNPERSIPHNVNLKGTVSDEEKWRMYKRCAIAINPMFSGAGINIKNLEYMAVGIPFVSTPLGVRGIKVSPHTPLCEGKDFFEGIKKLLESEDIRRNMTNENRKIIEDLYSWVKIAKTYKENLQYFYDYKNVSTNLIDSVSHDLLKMGIDEDSELIDKISFELNDILGQDTADHHD
jgi:glycosyltransferase involved in cell wall biosynthesis